MSPLASGGTSVGSEESSVCFFEFTSSEVVSMGVFGVGADIEACSNTCSSLEADSASGTVGISLFFGHVLALCPGRPQMLHFLDMVEEYVSFLGMERSERLKISEAMTT